MSATLIRAARMVDGATVVEDGGLYLRAGRIERVLRDAAAVRHARAAVDHELELDPSWVLTPGLVNAHAHLDLTGLAGRLPRGASFGAWVAELLNLRQGESLAELEADWRRGAHELLASGTTTVGDIDSTGAGWNSAAVPRPRVVQFREALDAWDPARTAGVLAGLQRVPPPDALRIDGLSPHAPFTVSPALARGLAALRVSRPGPLCVHWSETEAEVQWCESGGGPWADWLPASPRQSGLDLLESAGLLEAPVALVHGNHPRPGEAQRLAAAGCVLIHCPGTHEFFGREPFPAETYRRAGVVLALGTDSLASNDSLDLRAEMARWRRTYPQTPPGEAWAMGTDLAARALGLAGQVGALVPGARADLVAWDLGNTPSSALLDALTTGAGGVRQVWIEGASLGRAADGFRNPKEWN